MKHFVLQRLEDVSGTSGIGIVAEGTQFSNGKCVINWLTGYTSLGIYDTIEELIRIHGHGNKTVVIWLNEKPPYPLACLQCITRRKTDKFEL